MPVIHDQLSQKKIEEITSFLIQRFNQLDGLRSPLDVKIKSDIDLYNNIDPDIDAKPDWEEKYKVPYTYTVVQTIKARVLQSFFGKDNYISFYMEDPKFKKLGKIIKRPIEQIVAMWVQEEVDKLRLRARASDFIDDALVQRTTWLQLRPIVEDETLKDIELEILRWFDVWFDTKQANVNNTDFFVRKMRKIYEMWQNEGRYIAGILPTVEQIAAPDDNTVKDEYQAKNETSYSDLSKNNITDEVELLEYMGVYNMAEGDGERDYQEVVFTLANRQVLIRAEIIDLGTKRKRLLFPIRPLKQSQSLIGKSVPQLIRDMAKELNETKSLRMQNMKMLVKLMFKYKRDGGIRFSELFGAPGNAIGWDDDPNEIDTFQIPDLVQPLSMVAQDTVADMQQVTGAVDYIMGTSAGRGITDTATGVNTITQQALFKFTMIGGNIYTDVLDLIVFIIVLKAKYGADDVILRYPDLEEFILQTSEMIEDSSAFDIALTDIAAQRDIERSQFINMVNIIAGLVKDAGGNVREVLRQLMERMQMDNVDMILPPSPEELGGAMAGAEAGGGQDMGAAIAAMIGGGGAAAAAGGGSAGPANAAAPSEAMPVETAAMPNPTAKKVA